LGVKSCRIVKANVTQTVVDSILVGKVRTNPTKGVTRAIETKNCVN